MKTAKGKFSNFLFMMPQTIEHKKAENKKKK